MILELNRSFEVTKNKKELLCPQATGMRFFIY